MCGSVYTDWLFPDLPLRISVTTREITQPILKHSMECIPNQLLFLKLKL